MELAERYRWQATFLNGSVVTEGSNLQEAILVSFIPQIPTLPRHDLIGLPFVRRFGRGFLQGLGGGMREYLHCIVGETFRFYVRSSDGTVLLTPFDYELYL